MCELEWVDKERKIIYYKIVIIIIMYFGCLLNGGRRSFVETDKIQPTTGSNKDFFGKPYRSSYGRYDLYGNS